MKAAVCLPPRTILLSGATGFVGRFLLQQLLTATGATLLCLVRGRSATDAMARLRAMLVKWDLWRDEHQRRIVAINGDLRLPRLGLDEVTYEHVCRTADSIYHCATSMNHLEPYEVAKPANVEAVKQILRIATSHRPKAINYVSTLGVFTESSVASRKVRVISEASSIDNERHLHSAGYLASKWVGEKLSLIAAARGIPCNVFRLGLVWADSQQGRFDELQNVYRILKSSLLSGHGVQAYRFPLPPTPVDYVARAVTHLAELIPAGRGIFHISSAAQMSGGVFEGCNEMLGTPLELVPLFDWIQVLKEGHLAGRPLPAVPVFEYAFSMDETAFQEGLRRSRSEGGNQYDCSQTHLQLEKAGIVAPELDPDLLRRCLEDMASRDRDLRDITVLR